MRNEALSPYPQHSPTPPYTQNFREILLFLFKFYLCMCECGGIVEYEWGG